MYDEFPLDTFVGEAIILDADIEKSKEISVDILKNIEIKTGDIVLIRTGHSKYWGEEKYIDESPYINEELGLELSKLDIKAVGIDCLSLDPVEDLTTPIHNILMEKNIILIENLNNLHMIQDSRVFFSAAPLLIDKSDGSLIRAYAVIFDK